MKKIFFRGMMLSAVGRYSNVLAVLAVNAVLSRILTPTDFGLVALVTTVSVFLDQVAQAGIQPAVVQDGGLGTRDLRVLFNFSIAFSLLGCGLLIGIGAVVGAALGDHRYGVIAIALAPGVLFRGAVGVPTGVLLREHRFGVVNLSLLVSNFVGGGLAIVAALSGVGVLSLPIQTGVTALVNLLIMVVVSKIWFVADISTAVVRRVMGFASNQFGFNLINYLSRNLDTILVGRFLGPSPLGNYNKAYDLVTYPNGAFLGLITPVLQPVLAKHQTDVGVIRAAYFRIFHVLALLGMSVSVFMAIAAEPLVMTLFGEQWGAAVLPCSILSTTVWVQMTMSSSGAVFQACNRPRLLFWSGVVGAVILGTAIVVGVCFGTIVAVAIALSIGFYLDWIVCFWLLTVKVLRSKMGTLLGPLWRPAVIAIVAGIFVGLALHYLPGMGAMLQLAALLFVAVVAAGITAWVVGELKVVLSWVR